MATVHYLLRLACAWCFVGHGFWGLYQKPAWLTFYDVFGVPHDWALVTMPMIGFVDIACGIAVLFVPCRGLLVWLVFWATFTALLRPMAGLGWWEFFERGGNYAPPLALLALSYDQVGLGWFRVIRARATSVRVAPVKNAEWVLRVGIALLLIGHGGFAAWQQKPLLIEHWAAVGVDLHVNELIAIGWGEIAVGCALLVVESVPLMMAIAVWKVLTEFLYPIAGTWVDVFEWVERGGGYFAPLALIALWQTQGSPRSGPAPAWREPAVS